MFENLTDDVSIFFQNSLDLMAELTIVAMSAETTMMVSNLEAQKQTRQ